MIRLALPAAICISAHAAGAQTLSIPDLPPGNGPPAYTCENTVGSQDSCVRVLACVGDHDVFFDGAARGWDTGSVSGFMSDGVTCTGAWTSGGMGGTGLASLTCDGGLTADVIYYSQDGETGTVIGRGVDS